MKFAPLAAAVLALAAIGAQAQPAPAAPMPGGPGPMAMHDGMRGQMHEHFQQRMQERHQRRMEGLKRILQLTPAQEGAWSAFAAAMQPTPRAMQQRPNREEFEHMTTPQRIDRMRQLRAERSAEMDKRADATKTFYAQLTPAQQKAFDEISLKFLGRHGRGGHGGHGRFGG